MSNRVKELAMKMHAKRCRTCMGEKPFEECSAADSFLPLAEQRIERRIKATVGHFIKGKPKSLTKLERKMEMGRVAAELRTELDYFTNALINDKLKLSDVANLYQKMMNLATINKRFKKSVCKE